MGSYFSAVKRIGELRFAPFPVRATKMAKVVRVDDWIFGLKEGSNLVYTNHYSKGNAAWIANEQSVRVPFKACVKLGLITKEEVAQDKIIRKKREAQDAAKACLQYDVPSVEKYVNLTKAQKAKIQKAASGK